MGEAVVDLSRCGWKGAATLVARTAPLREAPGCVWAARGVEDVMAVSRVNLSWDGAVMSWAGFQLKSRVRIWRANEVYRTMIFLHLSSLQSSHPHPEK